MLNNFDKPWTREEIRCLIVAVDTAGPDWEHWISYRVGRSPSACRRKWQRLLEQNRASLKAWPVDHRVPRHSFMWSLTTAATRFFSRMKAK
ncbi:SANT/Myb-like DNA-binding domain-containing protein [Streptomyces sp. NPDC059708]|uniref:SANT/Myb-like DNA-binding domain-containing protein n=1 Tax=Streptomyces sp. NPDC059708 TaxID=3346916 RepID=UPI0036C0C73B